MMARTNDAATVRPARSSSRRAAIGGALAFCLLFLAGCMDDADGQGGQDGATDGPGEEPAGDDGTGAGDGGDAPQTHEVEIQGFQFRPATLEIAAGDTVRWTNRDGAAHTATGDDFDTGSLAQGQSEEVTFDEAGSFGYICSFHPSMQGTIVVS